MEWRGRRGSSNIEDRRAQGPRRGGVAVGGIGGVLVLLLLGAVFGVDVSPFLQGGGEIGGSGNVEITEADQEAAQFVSVVLADTEEVWARVLPEQADELPAGDACPLQRGHAIALRQRLGRDRAVLLPTGQEGISGHGLFRHDDT